MNKSKITKEIEEEIKKEKKTMKKSPNWTVINSVLLTLAAVLTLAGTFYAGMNYNQSVNDRVHAEVQALTATVTSKN